MRMYHHLTIRQTGYSTVVESMLTKKVLAQPIVSIWLGRQRVGGSAEGSGGAVIFGGVDTTKYVGNFTWVPVADRNAWKIPFQGVSIAGKNLGLSGNALIDSGTSLIVVPAKAASTFHDHIPGAIDVKLDLLILLLVNGRSGYLLNFISSNNLYRYHRSDGSYLATPAWVTLTLLSVDNNFESQLKNWLSCSGSQAMPSTAKAPLMFPSRPLTPTGSLAHPS